MFSAALFYYDAKGNCCEQGYGDENKVKLHYIPKIGEIILVEDIKYRVHLVQQEIYNIGSPFTELVIGATEVIEEDD